MRGNFHVRFGKGVRIILNGTLTLVHYNPSVLEAFNSVEHIMRDVNNGWLIRYLHSNTASAFFFLVYLHIGRGLYYGSYRAPRTLVWTLGTIIFVLMMATGFLGLLHSPKWFKLNNNNNNNNNNYVNSGNNNNNKWSPIKSSLPESKIASTRKQILLIKDSSENISDEMVAKYWAKKYPFYPEHHEQVANSSAEASNEAWWLAQTDNTLEWYRPTDESFYLDKLFDENSNVENKQYSKWNRTSNRSFSNKGNVRHFSTFTRSLNIESKEPNNSPTTYSKNVNEFLDINNIKPVYIYENLGDKSIQSKVLDDTRNLAGVYLILNKFNLSCYVGSASTGKFNSRFRRHLFNFEGSKIIKAAVKKYKIDNFAFIILDIFTEIVTKENNKQLLDMEDYYIKSLLPDYNIVTEAGNTFGYKHSEITRLKMVQNYSPERRLWIGNLNRNKSMSEQHKENIIKAGLTWVKPIYSKETLANIRKSSKPIIVYNLDKTVYGEYPSITAGAQSLRCSIKTINRAMNTQKKILKRRWIVKFLEK